MKSNVIFIAHPVTGPTYPPSAKLMGSDISEAVSQYRPSAFKHLNQSDMLEIKDSVIVILGMLTKSDGNNMSLEFLKNLKQNGNIIINNAIDDYCYVTDQQLGLELQAFDVIDSVIFTNSFTAKYFATATDVSNVVIPHHYDKMLNYIDMPKIKDFKVLYGGNLSAYRDQIDAITKKLNDPDWIHSSKSVAFIHEDLMKYPCHISYREPRLRNFYFKPGTKLASAAGSDSVIIMSRDESHVDLVSSDYPFFVDSIDDIYEKYEQLKSWYGTSKWSEAVDLLKDVKLKTDINTICKTYIKHIEELENGNF